MSKKVLIIPDVPNWALDKNAKDLLKYNRSDLQLDICYADAFFAQWERYYREYDLLFPMYVGTYLDFLKHKIPLDKVVTGIRSFNRWDRQKTMPPGFNVRPPKKLIKKLRRAVLVNTHCFKLWLIFNPYVPLIHTKYTCDLEIFYPENKTRNDKLVIGWAGSLRNHPHLRGFDDLIKPICDEIPEVQLKVQTREENFIQNDHQMRAFYNSLDLYICASRSEGTPRPVLEAAACGVPVISTDVGIVPELIDHGVNGFIVQRSYRAIKEQLLQIVKNREQLATMGNLLRQKMEREFNWEHLIFQWTDFFKNALEVQKLKKESLIK